ncbi:lysine exporter protein LysE/YggA [Salinisphaera sp. T5B8]
MTEFEMTTLFSYSVAHWAAFFTAALLLNLTPGPDMAYVLAHSLRRGRRAGFVAMGGVWTGAFVHVVLAALGLSAVLASSAAAFALVKYLGAAYLVWLGIQAWRASGEAMPQTPVAAVSARATFGRGVLVAALNPKVAMFFLAFLPQFVVPGAGPVAAQLFLHGCLIIVVAAFVEPPMVWFAATFAQRLRSNVRVQRWLDRALGSLFIALGARLAVASRT